MKKLSKILAIIFVVCALLIGAVAVQANYLVPEFPTDLPEIDSDEIVLDVPKEISEDISTYSVPIAKEANSVTTKEELFERMLNSVDYFNTAEVCFDLLMPNTDEQMTCYIETNLLTGESYETTVPLNKEEQEIDISSAEIESYSDGEYVTNYYNNEKKYCIMYPSRERMLCEQELPEDLPRVFMGTGDDVPSYINRADPTNTVFGSYCLFPQGFTFGFLTDLNLWEIDGNTQYLDRDCIMLSGWATGSYGEKLGVQTFSMIVDSTTGILLKLEGKDQRGEITTYMTVNSISIDGPVAQEMDQHDMSKYEDYTEINTGMLFE